MYDFYCDPRITQVVAEARAARREAVREMWTGLKGRIKFPSGRVASS